MARPTKYKPEFVEQAKHLCKLGAIDDDLAEAFHVDVATVQRWKLKYPEFCGTIKENKDYANEKVKRSLFNRAIGCSVPDTDIRVIEGVIVETPLEKHFPPDTTACMAWLHNRDSDNWKPRKAVDGSSASDDKATPMAINFIMSDRVIHDDS